MRKKIREAYKNYVRVELLRTRSKEGLSQEKMAAILEMSYEAYNAIETGKSCCGPETLSLYLVQFRSDDKEVFMDGLYKALAKVKEKSA